MLPLVHAEEHNRAYLQEVLDYFLQERAEAFAAGAAPYPLGERGRGGRLMVGAKTTACPV